jgi:hypothetical protein
MTQVSNENLTVALLLSEIEEIKEFTNVFRKLGVIPYYYEDLKSFWQGTLERIPSLAIVDVKKMSEGNLVFKNHPNIIAEEMPLLFYYTEKTEPLLVSTQEIFNLGTIKKSKSYEGVLKGMLKRINKMILLEQENQHLKYAIKAKNDELNNAIEEKKQMINVDHYQGMARELCRKTSEINGTEDFNSALEKIIGPVIEFENFSVVELSFNGQKLLSPISLSPKYRAIPSIWLGQVCKEGIELFAQNMAAQVAQEILGGNIISLLVQGKKNKPEKIIFIKTCDEQCLNHFDWELFESFLNGLNANIHLKEIKEQNIIKRFGSTFDAMGFLDQFVSGTINLQDESFKKELHQDSRLINLDLGSIKNILLKNGQQRFYWKKFRDDFLTRLEMQSKYNFIVFENGISHLGFIVNAKELNYFFEELKDFSNKFAYWKYFENNDAIIFQELKPIVKMSPLSSFAYLKDCEEKILIKDMAPKKSKVEINWTRERENEI